MISKTKGIPAVAYYRMSSKKQDTSIPAQQGEVERYAKDNGYCIVRWKPYVDEGISGAESEKREGFQRLISDATDKGDFSVILCWDQDRFSRFDPLEANHYWYILRQVGVRIVTVRQGELNLNELGGWLMASINQHGKAQYLRDLSANVLRGRLRKAKQGLWTGRACYGYRVTPAGKLELGDSDQVDTVRWLFETYADQRGYSLRDLAKLLNERGVPSPGGGQWTGARIQHLLKRTAYVGRAVQLRESKGKFNTIRGGQVAPVNGETVKPEAEWHYVDCPPIISQELFDAVQAKRGKRRTFKGTPSRVNRGVLTGLLFCGHCGARMSPDSRGIVDSSGDVVYSCSTYNTHGTSSCNRHPIHQGEILPFLIEQIQQQVLAPENYQRLRSAVHRKLDKRREKPSANFRQLKGQLTKLDRDVTLAASELKRTPDDLYDLAVADLRKLRRKRDRVAAELEVAQAMEDRKVVAGDSEIDNVVAVLETLSESIRHADHAVARNAFTQIIKRIDLWFDHEHFKKITRSRFRKGLVRFQKPTNVLGPVSRPY